MTQSTRRSAPKPVDPEVLIDAIVGIVPHR